MSYRNQAIGSTIEVAQSQGTYDSPALLRPPSGISREDSPVGILDQSPTTEPITEAAIWAVLEPLGWTRWDIGRHYPGTIRFVSDTPFLNTYIDVASDDDPGTVPSITIGMRGDQAAGNAPVLRALADLFTPVEPPPCPTCRGSGRAWVHDAAGGFGTTCRECDGTGTR